MAKLALPDGNLESGQLDIVDLAQAIVICDAQGRKMIMLVKKDGQVCYVRHTDGNVEYLASIGVHVSTAPPAVKVGLTP